jgi:hypothetical protein
MRSLKLGRVIAVGALGCAAFGAPAVEAQQAPYVGEIKFGAFSVCPVGWTVANGQILPIATNETLFAVIGTALAATVRRHSRCRTCAGWSRSLSC